MHDGDRSAWIYMGMRVLYTRLSVRCPAGVTDADASVGGVGLGQCFEIFEFALCFEKADAILKKTGDARRVVAAVF